jgi:hypothetical protein
MSRKLDQIIERSLRRLAEDTHVRSWCAKDNDMLFACYQSSGIVEKSRTMGATEIAPGRIYASLISCLSHLVFV